MDTHDTREIIRKGYADIARGEGSCCGKRTAASTYAATSGEYAHAEGYVPEADMGLGCGIPTEHAGLRAGQTVLDLGCGAGNDVFVARRAVGDAGKVIGVDFTPEMLEKAERNREKLGYPNVVFRQGEIEELPLECRSVDVVISNCVLNLVPDKAAAFREIFRVLKPGGHFCVSDIVLEGELPPAMRKAAEFYVGCVAGALQRAEYLRTVAEAGFEAIETPKEREVAIPDEDLRQYMSADELAAFRASGTRIVSLTVRAARPAGEAEPCCGGHA